jgi:hypothetical protein
MNGKKREEVAIEAQEGRTKKESEQDVESFRYLVAVEATQH